jgi:hypothetical protein
MTYDTGFSFDLTQILISKKFEKEIVFESYVLAWIRSRIELNGLSIVSYYKLRGTSCEFGTSFV